MRIPLGLSLLSRDGGTDRDAKVLNGVVEQAGTDPSGAPILRVRKRPGNADLGLVKAGTAQLLYNWNGIKAILGDFLNAGTIATIVSGPTQTNLSPTNAGLQFSAQETGPSVATPRLMIKNRSQAWTVNRAGVVSSVTYGGTMGSTTYNVTSLTRVGTVATAVMPTDPGFNVGDSVTIAGATPIAYNGAQTVTGTVPGSFTPARNIPITSLTRVSTLATAVAAAHGLVNGSTYTVSGANQSAYNVAAAITVLDVNTFTYAVSVTTATSFPTGVAGTLFPAISIPSYIGGSAVLTANFGATAFVYTPPAGHSAIGSGTTWNPADKAAGVTLSGGNLVATCSSPGTPETFAWARATTSKSTGKWYWEVTVGAITGAGNVEIGTASASMPSTTQFVGQDANGWSYDAGTGWLQHGGLVVATGTTFTTGDVIGVALDLTDGSMNIYKNNVINGSDNPLTPATGTIIVTDPAVTVQPSFTFTIAGSPATPATGTITVQGSGGTVPGIPYIDGYFCVMDSSGVVWNSAQDDPTTWGALSFFTAQNEPGAGKALTKSINYLVALKEWTSEFYYDAKNPTGTPFSPVDPGFVRIGCASGDSLAAVDGLPTWVSQAKDQPGRSVHVLQGLTPSKISTPDVERVLNADNLATVYAFGMKLEGHALYLLTLVTSNITLVFDFVSKVWQEWSSLTLGTAKSVVSITRVDDLVTVKVITHGLNDGDPVKISGLDQQEYNGIFPALVVDADHFTIEVSGSPTTPATPGPTYATLNPSDKGSGVTLSNGNLSASCTGTNTMVRGTQSMATGKWYWEVKVTGASSSLMPVIGIAKSTATLNNYLGQDANGYGFYGNVGTKINSAVQVAFGAALATNDVVGVAYDADLGTLTFYRNGVSLGAAFTGLSGTFFPALSGDATGAVCPATANFGATAFVYTPPTGYNPGIYTTTVLATPYVESYFKFTKAASYQGQSYLLHETNGHIYQVSPTLHQDAGLPIKTFGRTIRIDGGSLETKKMPKIRIIGDSVDDRVLVRWSDDDCQTFSGFRSVDLSDDQPETRKCGVFKRRTLEIQHIGNNPINLTALELS